MVKYLKSASNWVENIFRGLIVGIATGLVICLFANTINWASGIYINHPFLCLLIPIGALVCLFVYSHLSSIYKRVTVTAIDEIHSEEDESLKNSQKDPSISPFTGVVGYLMATMSHLLGVSTGKEGVGVQIGLAISDTFAKIENFLKRKLFKSQKKCHESIYLMSGASAAFGSLFGSPISGILFGTQFASPDVTRLDAFLPCTISSYASVFVSRALNIHILQIPHVDPLPFTLKNALLVLVFGFIIGITSRLFCYSLEKYKNLNDRLFKNRKVLKVLTPSLIALAIMLINYAISKNFLYNGLSIPLLYASINGTVPWYSFLLKAVLIFLGIASGFVGGEVVPLLVIGACLGSTLGPLFGLSSSVMAVFGALSMLAGGTNLPLVTFALSLELFHYSEPLLLFLSISIAFVSSGKESIYDHQKRYIPS